MSTVLHLHEPDNDRAPALPPLHEQWAALDLAEALVYPSLLLVIGQSNSILDPEGAQAHEKLWQRARRENGTLSNTVKLTAAVREANHRVAWTRYDIFRETYPQSFVDKAQYDFWNRDKLGWTEADKKWDADLVDDIKAITQPEDVTLFYATLGNPLLGTMLPQHLAAWGVRTILIAGYHLDWCIEQAARTARDIGYNPIVIGDATAAGREIDEYPTLERLNTFFAPVISTEQTISLLAEGRDRRRQRGWP